VLQSQSYLSKSNFCMLKSKSTCHEYLNTIFVLKLHLFVLKSHSLDRNDTLVRPKTVQDMFKPHFLVLEVHICMSKSQLTCNISSPDFSCQKYIYACQNHTKNIIITFLCQTICFKITPCMPKLQLWCHFLVSIHSTLLWKF
jgi:hypothetical protein